MTIRTYQPKGSKVKALRFDCTTADEARDWVVGSRFCAPDGDDIIRLQFPTFDGIKTICDGEWIVWSKEDGFSVMSGEEFASRYELVKGTTRKNEA